MLSRQVPLPRLVPLFLAVLCGLLMAPVLTALTYSSELLAALHTPIPAGLRDLFSMAACGLGLLLFPLIGLVYTLADRKHRSRLTSRISGASLAAWLTAGFQFTLGQTAARLLGVDPSAESQATLVSIQSLFGPLITTAMLIFGMIMAAVVIAVLACMPIFLDENALRRRNTAIVPQNG